MSKPMIAIVGRPNAGRSMLFSVITGDTISTVKDTPGATRDRIYMDCDRLNMNFTPINTEGIKSDSKDIILPQMREQTEIVTPTADVIIFIVDIRQGLVDSGLKMAGLLHKSHKPVVLAVNKVDSVTKYDNDIYELYNLGIGEPVTVSVASRLGIGDLLDEVVRHFDSEQMEEEGDKHPRIVVVGKPNAGRSSITNKLVGENRIIMSDIVGTTRDVMGMEVIHEGTLYISIDTASPRRKSKIKEGLERYSTTRTVSAMERADVVVVVIDTTEGVTEQDVKIARIAHGRGKEIIIAVNKWDAIEKADKTAYEYTREIKEVLSLIPYAECLFISAAAGWRLTKLFKTIDMACQNQNLRAATGALNRIVTEVVAMQQPPSDKGERPEIYHMIRVAVKPPTFVVFVNDKEPTHFSYTRYPESQIRSAFGFKGTSLKSFVREQKGKEQWV